MAEYVANCVEGRRKDTKRLKYSVVDVKMLVVRVSGVVDKKKAL